MYIRKVITIGEIFLTYNDAKNDVRMNQKINYYLKIFLRILNQ